MTLTDVTEMASANLKSTYFKLAMEVPGVQMWYSGELEGCFGSFQHPMSNFGVASVLSTSSAAELLSHAQQRRAFHVYLLPGATMSTSEALLKAHGFTRVYTLVEMAALAAPQSGQTDLRAAVTPGERSEIARFMVGQFFARQRKEFRDGIANATTSARGLSLYGVERSDRIAGSLMINRAYGMAGVYNLCVAEPHRGKGIGRSMVEAVLAMAAEERLTPTLQCDPRLAGWYESLGFRAIGEASTWVLDIGTKFDTM